MKNINHSIVNTVHSTNAYNTKSKVNACHRKAIDSLRFVYLKTLVPQCGNCTHALNEEVCKGFYCAHERQWRHGTHNHCLLHEYDLKKYHYCMKEFAIPTINKSMEYYSTSDEGIKATLLNEIIELDHQARSIPGFNEYLNQLFDERQYEAFEASVNKSTPEHISSTSPTYWNDHDPARKHPIEPAGCNADTERRQTIQHFYEKGINALNFLSSTKICRPACKNCKHAIPGVDRIGYVCSVPRENYKCCLPDDCCHEHKYEIGAYSTSIQQYIIPTLEQSFLYIASNDSTQRDAALEKLYHLDAFSKFLPGFDQYLQDKEESIKEILRGVEMCDMYEKYKTERLK